MGVLSGLDLVGGSWLHDCKGNDSKKNHHPHQLLPFARAKDAHWIEAVHHLSGGG